MSTSSRSESRRGQYKSHGCEIRSGSVPPHASVLLTILYLRLYSSTLEGKLLRSGLSTAAVISLILTDRFGSENLAASHRASDGRTRCLAAMAGAWIGAS